MSEIRRMGEQLKRAFEGEAWHGPAVLELLDGVTAAQAAAHPIRGAHSIWEIVNHLGTWKSVVARRVLGEVVKNVPDDVDWPPVRRTGEGDWKEALERLRAAHVQLRDAVARVRDEELDQPPYPEASARYVQIHGAIQHDLYHAGQIAVLKKG